MPAMCPVSNCAATHQRPDKTLAVDPARVQQHGVGLKGLPEDRGIHHS